MPSNKKDYFKKYYYPSHKKHVQKYQKDQRTRYIDDWVLFFKSKYGGIPKCQICKEILHWSMHNGTKKGTAHFDHKTKNVPIKCNPCHWLRYRPCNEKNKEIWNQCDFGILCHRCNSNLIATDRKQWLLDALQYLMED